MTAKQFFDLVSEMREAQIIYLNKKVRNPQTLQRSKDLEAAVDAEIARVKNLMNNQPTLFSKK